MQYDFEQRTTLGKCHRRYEKKLEFGITQKDRLHHMAIIGQTGTGKSSLMSNMALQDVKLGNGFCLIDPHGDLASSLSALINQPHIYWNLVDEKNPYGYNPLTRTSANMRPLVASGLIETLKKQWADAWGARMEHLLRFAILALLEQPKTDLRDIIPLFINKDFRRKVLYHVTDPQVLEFWQQEYKAMNYKTSMDGVAPIANKVGALLAHPIIRTVLCEPQQPLRFRKLMDEGQHLIINLSKGQLGTDMANVIGGLVVSSITHAAFSRYNISEDERRPFFLYVDEFPSFSTTAFATTLAEARKYALALIASTQHTSQVDHDVIQSVIGNVGTLFAFRVGAFDTVLLGKQLPDIPERELVLQPNYHAYVQLLVQGMKSKTFSATTYPPFSCSAG